MYWLIRTDWFVDWLTDTLTDRMTDWGTDWLTDWHADWLTFWLIVQIEWLTHWLTDGLIDALVEGLTDIVHINWLTDGWLTDCRVYVHIDRQKDSLNIQLSSRHSDWSALCSYRALQLCYLTNHHALPWRKEQHRPPHQPLCFTSGCYCQHGRNRVIWRSQCHLDCAAESHSTCTGTDCHDSVRKINNAISSLLSKSRYS